MRLPIAALLVGFGWTQAAAQQTAAQQTTAARGGAPTSPDVYVHTVMPRDTLIGVSRALLADPRRWPVLQRLNRVANPRRLRPGRPLDIPIDLMRTVPASADVLWVRGGPRVLRTDGTNIVALVGATVGEGSRVTTQAGEAVGVRLSTGATLTIGESADVVFEAIRHIPAADAARTLIDLRRGRIQNAVPPSRAPAQRYEIRTPVVTTAVRGTTFRVGVDDGGEAARAEVTEGTVGVARAAEAVDVAAGFGTVSRANVPLTPPRTLLPAPAIEISSVTCVGS